MRRVRRSGRTAERRSFLDRAVGLVERAPIVPSCAACAVPAAPPSADARHPHAQLRCCPSIAAPAHSSRHDDGERAPSRERAPFRPHRRAPTDVNLTLSFVAALLSPRRLNRAVTTTASARRAASTSFLDRVADLVERAPIVPSCAACAVPAAPPSADGLVGSAKVEESKRKPARSPGYFDYFDLEN